MNINDTTMLDYFTKLMEERTNDDKNIAKLTESIENKIVDERTLNVIMTVYNLPKDSVAKMKKDADLIAAIRNGNVATVHEIALGNELYTRETPIVK